MNKETCPAATRAGVIADWLAYGQSLDNASLGLTLAAFAAIVCGTLAPAATALLLAAILAGGIEKFLAMRVAFDQRLFAAWAIRWHSEPGVSDGDLSAFDAALAGCGLRRCRPGPARPLDDRLQGSLRLFRQQVIAVGLQFGLLAAAAGLRLLVAPT